MGGAAVRSVPTEIQGRVCGAHATQNPIGMMFAGRGRHDDFALRDRGPGGTGHGVGNIPAS